MELVYGRLRVSVVGCSVLFLKKHSDAYNKCWHHLIGSSSFDRVTRGVSLVSVRSFLKRFSFDARFG